MSIKIKETIPGIEEAKEIRDRLIKAGVEDVKLFYDKTILPHGMWCVCQIKKHSDRILVPGNYHEEHLKPMIMWWCKDTYGRFRVPNENDFHDILVVVKRAAVTWKKGGDKLEKEFVKQDELKEKKHRQAQRDRIHAVAPALKKAIRKELG